MDQVSVGEGALEVRRCLGSPDRVKVKDDYEIWLYPRCSVLMRFGKVVTVAGESLLLNQNLVLKRGTEARLAQVALSQVGPDLSDSRPVSSPWAIFFVEESALAVTHWMGRGRGLLPLAINVEFAGSAVSRVQLGDNGGVPIKDGLSVDESLMNWAAIQDWVATNGDQE